jgi:hypothetical protein
MSDGTWQKTAGVSPTLCDTRLQLHWAAQAAAGIGRTLVTPRSDDSHTSFVWSRAHGALLQECANGITGGIRLRDLTLLAMREGLMVDEFTLQGRTLDDAFTFFERTFGVTLCRPNVDLPPHAVASSGARFDANDADLEQFALHYANAAILCCDVFEGEARVRCWPHHFDIAALLTLAGEGEASKSIGIGLSPGDAAYPEPYYYVNCWPYPTQLETLTHGHWHTAGWTGAVLTATEIASAEDQEVLVRAFAAQAVEVMRRALSAADPR